MATDRKLRDEVLQDVWKRGHRGIRGSIRGKDLGVEVAMAEPEWQRS